MRGHLYFQHLLAGSFIAIIASMFFRLFFFGFAFALSLSLISVSITLFGVLGMEWEFNTHACLWQMSLCSATSS
ncbi:hypothetical protein QR685DRAFT_516405 [Neurospora intermedia]|uniref:Uncharacterized protein n=1 Tax=Neurospora intermedia TaxID=5142 RepID=A0ABR3DL08_NEUIN